MVTGKKEKAAVGRREMVSLCQQRKESRLGERTGEQADLPEERRLQRREGPALGQRQLRSVIRYIQRLQDSMSNVWLCSSNYFTFWGDLPSNCVNSMLFTPQVCEGKCLGFALYFLDIGNLEGLSKMRWKKRGGRTVSKDTQAMRTGVGTLLCRIHGGTATYG